MPKQSYLHPEHVNLAEKLSEDELGEIAATCLQEFKYDDESRAGWLSMHASWKRLYFQNDPAKDPPWAGSSQESLPLLVEACNQFHARAFQAMFPNRNIIRTIPVGHWDRASEERAKRISDHMSWQLMVREPSYKRNKDRMLLGLPLHGSFFTKTYYSPTLKRNVTDNVRPVDLVVPYGIGPRNIEDIDSKTQIILLSVNETKILERDGFFIAAAEPYDISKDRTEMDDVEDKSIGTAPSGAPPQDTAKILEQHRLLDLDDDGIAEPYIVSLDAQAEKVLRIAIRYDTDEAGNPTNFKYPVEYFTHYPFLENPDGFYGLGWGHVIGPPNKAVNKLLRQSIDAGTLSNSLAMSGFISRAIALKKGEIQMKLGKFVVTDSTAEDLNKGIWQPRIAGPNQALLSILELLISRTDRLASVEVITGQMDKVLQPTAIMALIEQSQQSFSAVYERVLGAWQTELMMHYRLNRKHMDPQEYFAVLDVAGIPGQGQIARADYADDLQVMPIADPRMTTKQQKLAKAEFMYQTMMSNPLIMNNPMLIYRVTRRFLEAAEIEYIDEFLPEESALGVGPMAQPGGNGMVPGGTQGQVQAPGGLASGNNMGTSMPTQGAG